MNKIGPGKNKKRIHYEYFGSGKNKIGPGKNKKRLRYEYFGSGMNKVGPSKNKILVQSMATKNFGSGRIKNRIWYE